jgi:type II secretory ATPase GspE/PulE/Tfp pilus assembly ATPase PilB-like protein
VVASKDDCVGELLRHLTYLSPNKLREYLDLHGGSDGHVGRRLKALGGLLPAGFAGGADLWLDVVARGWVTPEILADILASSPGMPEHRDSVGTLLDFLEDAEVATGRIRKAAATRGLTEGRRMLEVLTEEGHLTEARATDLAAEFYGLRRRRGKRWLPDPNKAGTITRELSEAFEIVPMTSGDDTDAITLLVLAGPGDGLLDALKQLTGKEVHLQIETPTRFTETLKAWEDEVDEAERVRQVHSRGRAGGSRKSSASNLPREVFRLDQDSFAGITYVPEMVEAILERGTAVGATDIHLEPQEGKMRVRFRLDGILHDVTSLRVSMGEDVISRIKVMSDMDITERRRPQDGHVHQELAGEPYDFRIATVPTSRGERMGIRITAGAKEVPRLDVLGLDDWEAERMLDFTRRSHGIVLACGPVGSGKTTTLYASLGELDAKQKNIMSIEDPVEIELPDVSQVHVNYKSGLDFSAGLRALLRQDPNIILVGEIRDDETAKVALRGSLTGLLVYSSIHANSAPGAVTTLYNFDIPPFLLATSLVGAVAQRLVRTICESCREQYVPEPALLRQAGLIGNEPAKPTATKSRSKKKTTAAKPAEPEQIYFRGRGCDECYGTGYRGRTGIFEILDVNEEMRQAISERAPEAELRRLAIEQGMQTLTDRGRVRVNRGETTVDEFIRVLYQ